MSKVCHYLVTGGGGFVGKALCLKLKSMGHRVTALSRRIPQDLVARGIECHSVNIRQDKESWTPLFKDVDGVFHTAALVEMWGDLRSFVLTNILGTKNVIYASKANKVPALVYTSSPSVIADGSNLRGVDESYPYPKKHMAFYPRTKAEAERVVRSADNSNGLRTMALRPHLIFGPGDTNLIPTVLKKAEKGDLKIIGHGENLVDLTYIDDCVNAHILAMQTLQTTPDVVGGKPYFISQGDPVKLWDWINQILEINNLKPVTKSVSYGTAKFFANIIEGFSNILQMFAITVKPKITRFLVSEMATDHYFDISAAERDFGYRPTKKMAEIMAEMRGASANHPHQDEIKKAV